MTKSASRRPGRKKADSLFHRILQLLKHPALWALGIVGAAGTAYLTPISTEVIDSLFRKTALAFCKFNEPTNSDPSRFTILLSPLTSDDRKETSLHELINALRGDPIFHTVPTCEPLAFQYTHDSNVEEAILTERARTMMLKNNADLLLFGEVLSSDHSIKLFLVSEKGACDYRPRQLSLSSGLLPPSFAKETKAKLINAVMAEISGACRADSSFDWSLFSKRVRKMTVFMDREELPQDALWNIGPDYSHAMRLLYFNDQGDDWFSKADAFNSRMKRAADLEVGPNQSVWHATTVLHLKGQLQLAKALKTHDNADQIIALSSLTLAIDDSCQRLAPDITDRDKLTHLCADALNDRGYLFSDSGDYKKAISDFDRAIVVNPMHDAAFGNRGAAHDSEKNYALAVVDFSNALRINPTDTEILSSRGFAYYQLKDYDHAILDYNDAIKNGSKSFSTFNNRGAAFRRKGDCVRAVEDYSKSIELNAKSVRSITSRAFCYSILSRYDLAIADYDSALELNPKYAVALFGRGLAKIKSNDAAGGAIDTAAAQAINKEIATEYRNEMPTGQ
jgi:tetratricopeptide (TPR) repeat protein